MPNPPKISIITAVFNGEQHIENTLRSVLGQTYPQVEYIVIDGGSTDKTVEIIGRYRDRIHCFISEKDHGIYDALNKGIAQATGEIVGLLHADDFYADCQTLQSIADQFLSTSADGVYSDLVYVKRSADKSFKTIRYWKSRDFTPKLLNQGWMPPHPTLYLKKSVYEQVGTFKLNFPIAADYDFILRVFKTPGLKLSYLPKVTVHMQVGGVSNRNLKKILEKSSQDFRILTENGMPAARTLLQKNLSKLTQFVKRKSS